MEWFTQIAGSLSGLPWWAVLIVVVLSVAATKGVDGLLRVLGFGFEREKYRDTKKKAEKDALVEELKDRIDKLEQALTDMQQSHNEERSTAAKALAAEQAAHARCRIEQEQLRGDLRVQAEKLNTMQVQIDRLFSHDKANREHAANLDAKIKEAEARSSAGP